MPTLLTFLDCSLLTAALFCLIKLLARGSLRQPPPPPGPKGLPFIGNILDFPSEKAWETYASWGEDYDGIFSLSALGQPIVVVDNADIAFDMLDKKSAIYSDRLQTTMLGLSGWAQTLALLPYGPRFRQFRKLIARVIGTSKSVIKFCPMQEYHSTMFLKRLLAQPNDIEQAIRKTAGAITMQVAYGYAVKEDGHDHFVDLAETSLQHFSRAATPGRYLVDMLPFLRFVPCWFPGATFKKDAREWCQWITRMADESMEFVREEIRKGTNAPSFAGNLMSGRNLSAETLYNIKWAAQSFYAAGSDTTIGTVQCYFLAMIAYPDVQSKLQAEMDSVIGRKRLPTFSDRASLPYLEAVCKELYRWIPIGPLGVPHRASSDDIHNGYFIKEGTLVIPNIWKMLHDPNTYSDPFIFNPERFLGFNPEQDPMEIAFGFGRRICPGKHIADATVWSSASKAAFGLNITKALDAQGNPVEPIIGQLDGMISRPIPFQCQVKPRGSYVLDLIKESEVKGLARC